MAGLVVAVHVSRVVVHVWCGLVWEAGPQCAFGAVARGEAAYSVQWEPVGTVEGGRCGSHQAREDEYVYRRDGFEDRCRTKSVWAAGGYQ